MFEFQVYVTGDFDRAIEAIGATESQVRTAAMRAINKTALWVQSKNAREISEKKKIQLKLIRQKLKVVKSNRYVLRAFIIANLYGIKASKLGHPKQSAAGASVGKQQFPGAFIAKMPKSEHVGIYKRKTTKRLPIQEQYVQLNPEASQIIRQTIENEASHIFRKYFDHEVEHAARLA
jgi:hypothetical protein